MRLLLLFLPLFSFAQSKNDSKIIVTADTANLYNRVAMAFYERGYTLDQKDETFKFFSGSKRLDNKIPSRVTIRAFVKDSIVTFSGEVKMDGFDSSDPIKYRGMKGSVWMDAWNEMETLARLFGRVGYSK